MVNLLRATLQSNACKSRWDAVDRGGPETGKIEEYFKAEFREWSSHSKSCQMFVHALEEIEKLQKISMLLLVIKSLPLVQDRAARIIAAGLRGNEERMRK